MQFRNWLESAGLDALVSEIVSRHPGLRLDAYEAKDKIELMFLELPKESRGMGVGTSVIRELQGYARSVGKPIVLRPEAERGRKDDLDRFYRNLGFVHNRGRNMDFVLSSPTSRTMYWRPLEESVLSEARTPKVIMYHGTAFRNLRSIMSHGLVPRPRSRAWSDDPDSSFNSASRASLDGIYITRNLMTALSAASNGANRKYMEEGDLLVAVEMQPKTAFADEDDLNFMATVADSEMKVADLYSMLGNPKYKEHVEKAKGDYRDRFFRRVGSYVNVHPSAMERLGSLADEVFEAALRRQAAYSRRQLANYFKDIEAPEKSEAERGFMAARERLTRTMKSLANPFRHKSEPFNLTGRVEEPIGFRGANRIVCVLHVPFDYKQRPRLIYGEVPDDLIRQWEERKGEWRGAE
jgi:hypothetical protein